MRLDVRAILKTKKLKEEYVELHQLIEGFKPACTGCSARSKLSAWKRKYSGLKEIEIIEPKTKIMENTFKLKKNRKRVSVPHSGAVITEKSKDALVWHYLNQVKKDSDERKRRESFFEVLPEPIKKIKKKESYAEKVDSVVSESEIANIEIVVDELESVELTDLDIAKAEYTEKFEGKKVPNRFKNDLDWINNKLGKE